MAGSKIFRLILIKPSQYDDNGDVIQWVRSAIPSILALNPALLRQNRKITG